MGKLQSIFFLVVLPLVLVFLYQLVAVDYFKLARPKPFANYLNKVTTTPVAAPRPQKKFDYFKLAQQWPPSVCKSRAHLFPRNFTIHGLWPHNFPDDALIYCDNDTIFNITGQILRERLNTSWPNIIKNDNKKFWEDEWKKHGTCALGLYNQTAYFTLALDLKDRYDLFQHLNESRIHPNNSYENQVIFNAIRNLTMGDPHLMCNNKILREIYICFNSTLGSNNVIDCPQRNSSDKCNDTIIFPPFKRHHPFTK